MKRKEVVTTVKKNGSVLSNTFNNVFDVWKYNSSCPDYS